MRPGAKFRAGIKHGELSKSVSSSLDHQQAIIMKSIAVSALALVCVIGLVSAQFGNVGYPGFGQQQTAGGIGNGGLLALIGFLFIFALLFNNTSTSSQPTINIVNGTGK